MSHRTLEDVQKRLETLQTFELDESEFEERRDEALDKSEPEDQLIAGYHKLLGEVSEQMNQMDEHMGMTPTCFMGCAFCCYFPIIVMKLEADILITAINRMDEERRDRIKQHLKQYFHDYQDKLEKVESLDFDDESMKYDYRKEWLPCPLLDTETNTCMAYESRPLPCRTYVNYMDPKLCENQLVPEETVSFEFLYQDYMGNLNEIAQEVATANDDVIDYPDDLFEYNLLPVFLKRWMDER
ncbi:Fe-S-cluster containining protein [Alkalibacillus flavidus]|uniref:Fe-S-cluster containining protein n=1 Tax=Alkalibacillus flavidus TaxID=546021 RepID=A0ABV2KUV3_9BACI